MLPSTYAPRLTDVATIEGRVADAPARIEYVVWSRSGRTPAASAFFALLGVPGLFDTDGNRPD